MNSRPLTPLTDDPADLSVLTPATLLIRRPTFLITEPNVVQENVPPLQRWKRTTQLMQRIWERWSQDYLQQLQKRVKWKSRQPSLRVEDLVLIRQELTSPSRRLLARIINVHVGQDNLVHVATVRTATTTLTRPIVKLVC